jgi:putative hydrolase of the HAD superfamily
MPGVIETLTRLGQAGLRLAVLSNRSLPFDEYLKSIGLDGHFETAVAAGDLAAWKPDPYIFFHTLEKMSLAPDQVVYVGDNYFADVIGAQRAGIQPVLLDPEGVFPEADCPVICSFSDLTEWLLD